MALTKLEENLNVIENLPDSPTLESTELKRKFDEGSNIIKEYINEVLIKEIDNLVNQIKKDVNAKILEDNKKKYYIGKIVLDTANVNPANYLGFGTWTYWGKGRVPVGVNISDSAFNTVEKTGGEKTHKLTISEMCKHRHKTGLHPNVQTTGWNVGNGGVSQFHFATGFNYEDSTDYVGGDQAHNNLQPYITCYMWKRVS